MVLYHMFDRSLKWYRGWMAGFPRLLLLNLNFLTQNETCLVDILILGQTFTSAQLFCRAIQLETWHNFTCFELRIVSMAFKLIGLSFRFCFRLRQSQWFSLDHKRDLSDRVVSGVGKNGNVLILLIPSCLWLCLRLRFLISLGIVIRGDWLWKAANINDENNIAAVYVQSTVKVHNPLFSVME